MSFWNKTFKVAKSVGSVVISQVKATANEIREIRQKFDGMSDKELLRVVHSDGIFSNSPKEKMVATAILKDRGLTPEEIKSRKA
jgi:hypothetical protein